MSLPKTSASDQHGESNPQILCRRVLASAVFSIHSDDSEKVQTLADSKGFVDIESSWFFQSHVHALKSVFQAHLQARDLVTIFQMSGFRQRKSIQSNGESRWQGWCNRLLREYLFPWKSAARERGEMTTMRIPIELPEAD